MISEEQTSLVKRIYLCKKIMKTSLIFLVLASILLFVSIILQSNDKLFTLTINELTTPILVLMGIYIAIFLVCDYIFMLAKNQLELEMYSFSFKEYSTFEIQSFARVNQITLPSVAIFVCLVVALFFSVSFMTVRTAVNNDVFGLGFGSSTQSTGITNLEPAEKLEAICQKKGLAFYNTYNPNYPGHYYNIYISTDEESLRTSYVSFDFDGDGILKSLAYVYTLDNNVSEEENLANANEFFTLTHEAVQKAYEQNIFSDAKVESEYLLTDDFISAATAEGGAKEFEIHLDGGGLIHRRSMTYSDGDLEESYTIFHSIY